jgi:homogentisate 1,2-dioxygenase
MTGDDLSYISGFGNALSSEARPGALPRRQNSPREVPFGLYAEQINGTGFTVDRAHNRRVWLYRLRPLVLDRTWEPASMGKIVGHFHEGVDSPQIQRFGPTPLPEGAVDFVDGLVTFAGAGDPNLKQGMAIHVYGANADMGRRSVANGDGDLFIAPWDGALRIRTELGVLQVQPGEFAVIPRAIRFSVNLPSGSSRGFVGELFHGHLQLPERGVVGANGLADERHFLAPVADFEDIEAEHELLTKQGGTMWKNTVDHSPFDVVAWHGKYAPFKYDLHDFNTLGSVSFDHPDPSILTVLTAPVDPQGRSALDVAVFKGRWDVAQHTFRPPYFHRNSAIEFNMVISAPPGTRGAWRPGAFTYTPYLMPHGVSAPGYNAALGGSEAPKQIPEDSIWLQFESTYLLRQTRWASEAFEADTGYLESFRGYRKADLSG